jgi:hypothetical protein
LARSDDVPRPRDADSDFAFFSLFSLAFSIARRDFRNCAKLFEVAAMCRGLMEGARRCLGLSISQPAAADFLASGIAERAPLGWPAGWLKPSDKTSHYTGV